MKILYGIQGTGNGHLTRARVMAPLLREAGMEVDYVLSGRDPDKLFDMQPFGDFRSLGGLTFITDNGSISYLKTLLHNNVLQFCRDIRQLQVERYDLVITDFEPVTAWAAKLGKARRVLGMGHQYAFRHRIPQSGKNPLVSAIMNNFAPAATGIGLHWHHFDQLILPPIIELPELSEPVQADKIIVYLPFERADTVSDLLAAYPDYRFFLYTADKVSRRVDNVTVKPLSRQGFQEDLRTSAGVISNAGFELASESLQMGKKLLVKPLHGQMEQLSNALALEKLGYGRVMHQLDPRIIAEWLEQDQAVRIHYPCTASAIIDWLQQGNTEINREWVDQVWENCRVETVSCSAASSEAASLHSSSLAPVT